MWKPSKCGQRPRVQGVLPVPKQPGRHVQFGSRVTVHVLPYYDRRSPWMTVAADRFRFERRIRETENILHPVLVSRIVEQLSGTFANVSVSDS